MFANPSLMSLHMKDHQNANINMVKAVKKQGKKNQVQLDSGESNILLIPPVSINTQQIPKQDTRQYA